jgi:Rrf2 family protein
MTMRLTRQTNYAMRILMYCGTNKDKLSRIPEIAAAYSVSELFLFKILQPLVENGLVETVRGRNGGVRLGRPAEKITLFDVVRVTEDSFSMAECFDNDAAECPARGAWRVLRRTRASYHRGPDRCTPEYAHGAGHRPSRPARASGIGLPAASR